MKRSLLRTCWLAGLAALATAAWAAPPAKLGTYVPPETHGFAPSPSLLLLRTVGSLVLVVGLVLVTAWFWRLKVGLASPEVGRRLRVIETVPLGPSRSLHLVAVGQRVLLVGGGSQVTCLATYTPEEVGWDPDAAGPSFEHLLARLHRPAREPAAAVEGD